MTTATQAAFARQIGVVRSHVTALKGRPPGYGRRQGRRRGLKDRIAATADPGRDDVVARHAASRASQGSHRPSGTRPRRQQLPGRPRRQENSWPKRQTGLRTLLRKANAGRRSRLRRPSAAVTLRTRLEAWPDTMAANLGGHLGETQRRALLAEAVEELLTGLVSRFNRADQDNTMNDRLPKKSSISLPTRSFPTPAIAEPTPENR